MKTDANGNWTYTLDKELENGEHQVYVAITDNTGKITAKSNPLTFVKTAQAVNVISNADAYSTQTPPINAKKSNGIFVIIIIIITALGITISIIGLIISKSKKAKINYHEYERKN